MRARVTRRSVAHLASGGGRARVSARGAQRRRRSVLHQRERGVGRGGAGQPPLDELRQRGAVLEPMARAAAQQPAA
jgi:hypothetical protein